MIAGVHQARWLSVCGRVAEHVARGRIDHSSSIPTSFGEFTSSPMNTVACDVRSRRSSADTIHNEHATNVPSARSAAGMAVQVRGRAEFVPQRVYRVAHPPAAVEPADRIQQDRGLQFIRAPDTSPRRPVRRSGTATLVQPLEVGTERLRDHLRRRLCVGRAVNRTETEQRPAEDRPESGKMTHEPRSADAGGPFLAADRGLPLVAICAQAEREDVKRAHNDGYWAVSTVTN